MEKRRKWLIAAIATALVLALGGGAAAYLASPDIPRGVTVLGVKIGGKSRAAATGALEKALAARSEELIRPFPVKIRDAVVEIDPQQVGMSVDVPGSVDKAAARNHFGVVFGRKTVDPVINLDAKKLLGLLKPTADAMGATATMPSIQFDGLKPRAIYGVPGKGLNLEITAEAVASSWLRESQAEVPIVDVIPASSNADVDRMIEELARPAVAAPVTVTTPSGEITATPEAIAASLVIDSDEVGKLNPHVDEPVLRNALKSELDKVEAEPKNATVGDGQIVASSGGTLVDTAKLAEDLLPVLPQAEPRTVQATMKQVEPKMTSADLTELGITEQVSTFTTYFSGGLDANRSINIITGAKEVDGAIVKPGETFSLNDFTGPRGYEQGYKDAPIIMNGKLTPGVGGGMSQFTTTLFNAAYYAGLEDVEHHPHTIYFSTYPSVVESTIFYPNLDLKFRNDTPHGILIDTSYTNDSITVSMWSTKVYDSVTTEWSAKRDFTEPSELRLEPGPECIARPGSQGFTQDAWRIFHKDGKEVKREKFTWRYDAEPRVTCGGRN